MDTSFTLFVAALAAMIILVVVINQMASRSDDKTFELADVKFYHVILKSKDIYVRAASSECGSLSFIDKMTFDKINLTAGYDVFGKLQVDQSYNLTLKGNRIIDIREEDF